MQNCDESLTLSQKLTNYFNLLYMKLLLIFIIHDFLVNNTTWEFLTFIKNQHQYKRITKIDFVSKHHRTFSKIQMTRGLTITTIKKEDSENTNLHQGMHL